MYEEMEPKDIKETGTETEEPRQTVRDYYADGTPVTRREEPKEPPRAQDPERPNYEPYRFGEPERQSRQSYRYSQPPQGGKRKNGKRAAAIVAALAAFSLFVGLLIAGISHLGDYIRTRIVIDEPTQSASAPEIAEEKEPVRLSPARESTPASASVKSVADVAEESMPAMVSITTMTVQQVYSFFGQPQSYEVPAAGSGIIVGKTDSELLIATNEHVVAGAKSLSVSFIDEEVSEGVIKGEDVQNDLAIVAVDLSNLKKETLDAITVIPIGDSDTLRIGEQVVAIGNALGFGQSVSGGYVSALNRQVQVDGEVHVLLQTDAAINPGNSGGALLNMNGELIGINEVKYVAEDTEGIGYAIPITFARPILDELMNRETRTKVKEEERGFIGITVITVTEQYAKALHIPVGAYVDTVVEGGAAEMAGIRPRDIITAVGDVSVKNTNDLLAELEYYRAGEEVTLTISRLREDNEYSEETVTVTLGNRPADPASGNENS